MVTNTSHQQHTKATCFTGIDINQCFITYVVLCSYFVVDWYEQYGVTINWSIKPTNQQARQETDDE
nr:hypothetical protein Iba_chr07dCG3170 [Ipomoea batatas]